MRFKDIRGSLFSLLLLMLDIALFVVALQSQEKFKMIIAILFFPIIVVGYFTQFYIRVLNDCMLVYRFIAIFALPTVVEYKNIESIEKQNKYIIVIKAHNKNYSIYTLRRDKHYKTIMKKVEDFKHENN